VLALRWRQGAEEQEHLPLFDEEFKRPDKLEIKKSESLKEIAAKEKDRKWSFKFDQCVKCGRNDVKHLARGLCVYCYQQETEKRGRGKQRIAKGLASNKLDFIYLYEQYVNKKRSLSDIAKDCDCSRQYVYKKITESNIPVRTQREARRLVYDRKKIIYKTVDENGIERIVVPESPEIDEWFFKYWSNEMAYVLGVIYTDGNLFCDRRQRIYRFSLTQKEPELLNKVLKMMRCNAKIYYRQTGSLYFFNVHHPETYSDLIKLGLLQAKSKTMEFPNVPPEFVRHFIRGCWDGDGSIYISGGKLGASYVCGSLKFIQGLVQELHKAGIHQIKPPYGRFPLIIHQGKRSKYYDIKIRGRKSLDKLFNYFYDGVDESMYLERKFKTFAKGLGIITDGLQEI
jgi:predicted DNA-binding protein YlxM (UPF0122 family)